ncbi:mucin-6-like [Arctopsyche grandis]|uniref:mucin-6-like n=1 Tax=Arctopsyche grandis TaxID=121162 RepID=UPI00406D633F
MSCYLKYSVLLMTFWYANGVLRNPLRCNSRLREVYSQCGDDDCQKSCNTGLIRSDCDTNCNPGCVCMAGYMRNRRGHCVLPDDCDCLGFHEEYSFCSNHPCRSTCQNPDLEEKCSFAPGCYSGCVCRVGYLRDENGKCVSQRRCHGNECFGPNEVYSKCVSPCGEVCANMGKNLACDLINCKSGCDCLPGFLRNDQGKCVPKTECGWSGIQCFGPNEIYSKCVSPCGEVCANIGQSLVCDIINCKSGCDCLPGFLRNSQGTCVLKTECGWSGTQCSGTNEIYSKCVSPCGEIGM